MRGLLALMMIAGLVMAGMVACGKRTAPIPPEDVTPDKQERPSSKLDWHSTFS